MPCPMSILARQTQTNRGARLNRRVLIVTDDAGGSVSLVEHLRDLSLDVSLTAFDGESLQGLPDRAPSAVLCFLSDYIEHGPAIVAELRRHYAPREFPILGRLMRQANSDHPYDSVLYAPVHPVQVAQRMSSLIRLGQIESEIVRRMETLRESFGQDISLSDTTLRSPFRILFIGRADPAYMSVVHALQDKNTEIVAAFTSFSAFDYLHDSNFDAVVINALSGSEPALTISETMRRNPRLFHVPTLLLAEKGNFKDAAKAFANGVNDTIDADADKEEISGRILELANEYRLHQRLKAEFSNLGGETCSDPHTGVLNARFLEAHLKRVSRDCRARKVPLTILTIKLTPESRTALTGDSLSEAYNSSIRLISGIVRMQDIVARIDMDTIVVAFPEERREEVTQIANRISELVEQATFELPGQKGESIRLRASTAIMEQGEISGENAKRQRSRDLPISLVS